MKYATGLQPDSRYSQRKLPTEHDYAVSTREYQTDQSSTLHASTAAALSSFEKNDQRTLTGHYISFPSCPLHARNLSWRIHCQGIHSASTQARVECSDSSQSLRDESILQP